ncbi:MAG: hypothetical protein CMJ64_23280 [Planctomycetaceae bacterium]|nr:hypothetical protein [Planctomycetaceae bacterium]
MNRKFLQGLGILFAVVFSFVLTHELRAELRAGAAIADITPQQLPVSMTGSFQDRQATGVYDRLNARCLVLDDGKTSVAIVVCDSCLITRDIFDAAKQLVFEKTGMPTSRMMISATHTHTAATTVALAQCHPDPAYLKYLTRQIAQSVIDAHSRLQPACVGWAVGKEAAEVNNRRWFVKPEGIRPDPFGRTDATVRMNPPRGSDLLIKPAGPIDPDVSILSVQHADGSPLSVLGNYSLHYVGGIPPNQLSADYFGEFARQIRSRVDGTKSFVGIMSNGTSGDVNNYNFLAPRPRAAPFERVTAVANRIANVSFAAYEGIDHCGDHTLKMIERTIDLGVRRPNESDVARAKNLLANAADPKRLNTDELYAQETLRLADYPSTVNIKLQALRIGDLGIVAIPCEVFAQIGLDIKEKSPFATTFTIALANGYNGYLPTPQQHAWGGYETWRSGWSYLEEDASTKILSNVLEMLGEL